MPVPDEARAQSVAKGLFVHDVGKPIDRPAIQQSVDSGLITMRMHDAAQSRYYIDPGTGQVVGSYNARQWVTRWLYQGLHSLSFPWLYKYRPLWDIVVIALMLGGTALCVTSVVLTWRVLARKAASVIHTRVGQPSDDLEVERVEG